MKQPKAFARIIAKNNAAAAVLADFLVAGRSNEKAGNELAVAPALYPLVKVCSCGARYSASDWALLRLRGRQHQVGGFPDLELRDCLYCTSTLGLEVVP